MVLKELLSYALSWTKCPRRNASSHVRPHTLASRWDLRQ